MQQYAENGELSDLIPFWMAWNGSELALRLDRTARQLDRLEKFKPQHRSPRLPTFTDRERQVLAITRAARTLQQMANELFVSPNTVKVKAYSLYCKLSARSKTVSLENSGRWGTESCRGCFPAD